MRLSCEVVRDLLPLYAEGIASKESGNLVKEHMEECQACRDQYEQMRTPQKTGEAIKNKNDNSLRMVKKELRKRKATMVSFVALLLLLFVATAFSQITAPNYPSYTKDLITVTEKADGTVYASFSDKVTAYHAEVQKDIDTGKNEILIEAWSTIWDRIMGKGAQIVQISSPEKPIDVALYCANEKEAVAIYGTMPYGSGLILLPKLTLGYYVFLAVCLAVILGAFWLIFRKKASVEMIIRYWALAPISYLIGHVCVKGLSTLSFSCVRDFIAILFLSIVVYFVFYFGILLIRQRRKDKFAI